MTNCDETIFNDSFILESWKQKRVFKIVFFIIPDSSKKLKDVLEEFNGDGCLSKYNQDEVCWIDFSFRGSVLFRFKFAWKNLKKKKKNYILPKDWITYL